MENSVTMTMQKEKIVKGECGAAKQYVVAQSGRKKHTKKKSGKMRAAGMGCDACMASRAAMQKNALRAYDFLVCVLIFL